MLTLLQLAFGAALHQIGPLAVALLRATLLQPYVLGSGVRAAWSLSRDVALSGLGCVLGYAAMRSMLGGGRPWDLVGRAAVAAVAAQLSLTLVDWTLAINNVLVQALAGTATAGAQRTLLAPLTARLGAAAGLLPDVLGLLVAAGAIWIALCYYLRAAEIVFLTLLAPFVAVLAVVPGGETAWRALLAELLPAVYLQAGQVLVLWTFLAVAEPAGAPAGLGDLLTAVAALLLLGRVRHILRGLCHAPLAGGRQGLPWILVARKLPVLGGIRRLAEDS